MRKHDKDLGLTQEEVDDADEEYVRKIIEHHGDAMNRVAELERALRELAKAAHEASRAARTVPEANRIDAAVAHALAALNVKAWKQCRAALAEWKKGRGR
jgi:uncharacterized protein (DUF305 family)